MEDKSYRDYIEEIDLQRYWLVLKRRWLPAALVCAACVSGVALWILSKESAYEADGKLLLQIDRSTYLTGVGEEIGGLETVGRSDPLATQAAIIRSQPILETAIDNLELATAEGEPLPVDILRRGLTVRPQGGTDVLVVAYESLDPATAAAVVNEVMGTYIERNITLNRSEARAAREFVEQQIPRAESEMNEAAEALRQFQLENQIVNLESEAGAAVGLITGLEDRIGTLRAELAEADTRTVELQQQLGMPLEQARQTNVLSESPGVQNVLANLQEIETALAGQRSLYTPNHPTIANLERQAASLRQLLNQRVGAALNVGTGVEVAGDVSSRDLQMSELSSQLTEQLVEAEVRRASLISQLQQLESTQSERLNRAASFPTLEKRQRELQQRLQVTKGNYERLLERLQASRLAENQVLGSATVIEPAAVPLYPVATSDKKLFVAGVGGGILLGIAVAFFLDLIDKSIKTVKDGEALLGYTLLGLIPQFDASDEERPAAASGHPVGRSPRIVAFSHTQPVAAASYQMLQANLKFISSDQRRRAITVTSSVAQEGKSEVCANLAATIAQAGKRVLLVDADMRSPSQHHLWNVINQIGLSHVLVGEGDLSQALHRIDDNLTLLTAGVVPPNPLALVDSERMGKLVLSWLDEYDYVLFDTPPLVGAADAAMLGKATDGVLLVLRPRWVDSASALSAKSLLERSGAEVLGIVANGIDIRNEHDDYVSPIKAAAYPYGQTTRPGQKKSEKKRKDRVPV